MYFRPARVQIYYSKVYNIMFAFTAQRAVAIQERG